MPAGVSSSEELRLRSKQIFGNRYMLEICGAIGGEGGRRRTNLTKLLGSSDLSPSVYTAPIRRLVLAGLLVPDEGPSDDRRERWYRPTRTGLWRTAQELAK